MFETDKTILGDRTNFEIDLNNKERLVYNYEIKKRLLEVFKINDILMIKKEDYHSLNIKEKLKPYDKEFLIIDKNILDNLINSKDLDIKYINR